MDERNGGEPIQVGLVANECNWIEKGQFTQPTVLAFVKACYNANITLTAKEHGASCKVDLSTGTMKLSSSDIPEVLLCDTWGMNKAPELASVQKFNPSSYGFGSFETEGDYDEKLENNIKIEAWRSAPALRKAVSLLISEHPDHSYVYVNNLLSKVEERISLGNVVVNEQDRLYICHQLLAKQKEILAKKASIDDIRLSQATSQQTSSTSAVALTQRSTTRTHKRPRLIFTKRSIPLEIATHKWFLDGGKTRTHTQFLYESDLPKKKQKRGEKDEISPPATKIPRFT